ncbi:ABC transporter substrate-binding protein [Chelatococcus asaccharovorans]|uniref:Amino acid/amide ABC transporter substrate-binding protein (HAAT family) n=1 Tax=Chelatococcus asaccharovorans TaxID=28210 RepID=A0A2V3UCN9_9HYPH|nr:ABC transporter substrate-binding protein [Chelatococcus asaccharovorans]MBS7703657.1 ABC transporter substrate-binding protein [Chelatococcus asaccharovorans]PXW62001.1 amino acid/amide ABC transporter substrate-binding protein (HAAT family) [Chelatococcus asaccharovorans]
MTRMTFGRRAALAAVLAATLVPAALAQKASAQDKTVKIGAIFAQTGPNASIGSEALIGTQYAIKKINEAGGVKVGGETYKFELVNIDDESKAERAVAAAEKLVADKTIPVILTPPSSTTTLAVVPIAEKNGRIALSFVASAPSVTGPDHPLSFRTTLSAIMNVAPSIEFLIKDKGIKKIAYIGRNDDWGRAAGASIADTAKKLGADVVMTEYFESGSTDFYGLLTKARAAGPEAVVGAAFVEDGVSMIKQYRELQLKQPFLSVAVIWASPVFLKAAGRDMEGVYISTGPTTSSNPELDAFRAAFKAETGSDALPFSITAVDNINLLAEAMKTAGSTDPQKIADALRKLNFKGLLQTYKFDGGTQSDVVININEVKDGKVGVISSLTTR